jgi:pyridoxine 5-phosphate synthase
MTLLFAELDHLGTLRQAGGGKDPDPAHAAPLAELAGVGGISATAGRGPGGLSERDLRLLREVVRTAFNLCLVPQDEHVKLALALRPDLVTFVPEPREPYGPEKGLDVEERRSELAGRIQTLKAAKIPVALLVDPAPAQLKAAERAGAAAVRLHTGGFCWAPDPAVRAQEYELLMSGAKLAQRLGLVVHAGGGIGYESIGAIVRIEEIGAVVVGHGLLARAMLTGIPEAVRELLRQMREGAAR